MWQRCSSSVPSSQQHTAQDLLDGASAPGPPLAPSHTTGAAPPWALSEAVPCVCHGVWHHYLFTRSREEQESWGITALLVSTQGFLKAVLCGAGSVSETNLWPYSSSSAFLLVLLPQCWVSAELWKGAPLLCINIPSQGPLFSSGRGKGLWDVHEFVSSCVPAIWERKAEEADCGVG